MSSWSSNMYTKKERTGTNGMDRTPNFIYFSILKLFAALNTNFIYPSVLSHPSHYYILISSVLNKYNKIYTYTHRHGTCIYIYIYIYITMVTRGNIYHTTIWPK